jgi:hypothetical protein
VPVRADLLEAEWAVRCGLLLCLQVNGRLIER